MKTKIKIAIIAMIGMYAEVKAQEIVKYDSPASYPSQTSRGNIFQLYRNHNQTLEFGVAGGENTRRSWILSRHSDLSGAYSRYYSTLHLQPDTGNKSQYRGVAIGFNADRHIGIGTHLAINGSVGVGTVTPNAKLDVRGDISITGSEQAVDSYISELKFINLHTTTSPMASIGVKTRKEGSAPYNYSNLIFNTSNGYNTLSEKMRITESGNVGIGVAVPEAKLDVKGAVKVGDGNWGALTIDGKGKNDWLLNAHNGGEFFFIRTQTDTGVESSNHVMSFMRSTGNVGIGTTTTGSHKLAVEGSIGAREIKVEASSWSDFVFEKEYKLPTLKEVENHIKEKGHLKDIPSAKEVEKNGFYLGEMDAKLLQKIEELTLYTIQQEKKLQSQDEKIKSLETQNNRIEKLEEENKKLKILLEKVNRLEKLFQK